MPIARLLRAILAALRALVDATLGDSPPPPPQRRARSRLSIAFGDGASSQPAAPPPSTAQSSELVAAQPILKSARVRKKIRAIFDAMDVNSDGVVSRDEAVAFGATFGLSRSEAERRAASMVAAVDRDGDAVLDPAEWEAWFDSMLLHAASARRGAVVDHAALDEKFVETFVDGVLATAERSRRPIKWSGATRRAFVALEGAQLLLRAALLYLTASGAAAWATALAAHEAALPLPGGAQGLIAFTAVVNAVGAFLSLVALAVPHAPPAERPRLLRSLGYASAVAMVLFLAAAAAQAVALSRGAAECALACGSCGEEPGGGGGAAAAWQEACAASAPACECGYELLGRRSEAVALAVPAAGWEEAMLGFVMNGTAAEDDLSPTPCHESSLPADVAAAAARVPLPGLETRTELGSLGTIRANATSSGWLLIFDGVYFELPLLGLYAAPSELLAGASSTRV